MDQGPDAEGPGGWGDVGLFSMVVVSRTSDAVDAATGEADVEGDIDEFEEDTVLPV